MAKIAIIAALDVEIEGFVKDFNAHPVNDYIYRGAYCGHDVYLTLCGVGKVNSAICTQRIIDYADPDYIINSGIAGVITKKLKKTITLHKTLLHYIQEDKI